jgi:hypothetical protein
VAGLVGLVVVALLAVALSDGIDLFGAPGGSSPDAPFDPAAVPAFPLGPDLGTVASTEATVEQIIELPSGYAPGNAWWVMLGEGQGRVAAEALLDRFDGDTGTGVIGGEIEYLGAYQFVLPEPLDPEAYLSATSWLESQAEVAAVSADGLYVTKGCADEMTGGDYASGNDGAYRLIGAESAWTAWFASGLPKSYVHIGVVDSPISAEQSGRPYEFNTATFTGAGPVTSNVPGPYDGFYHSDGVIGIVAGDRGDGGMVGLASPMGSGLGITHVNNGDRFTGRPSTSPQDSWYMNPDGKTSSFSNSLINVMKAVESGSTVVNMSFGPDRPDTIWKGSSDMWRRFLTKMNKEHPDVLFVVAAGNEGTPGKSTGYLDGHNYGAAGIASPNLITVANVRNDNTLAGSSNTLDPAAGKDAEVTLAAPGDQAVWGIGTSGALMHTDGGTSSAAPMVTSTAAMIRSLNPKLTAAEIKDIITRTARTGPATAGGRTLAFDRAVLEVVNDLRVKNGQKPLTDEDLVAAAATLCAIDVTGLATAIAGKPDAYDWKLDASLPAVVKATAITLTKNGLRPSDWRKPVSAAGQVLSWHVEVAPAGVAVIVTRQDSGYWLRYYLKGGSPGAATPSPEPTPTATPTPRPTPGDPGYDCSNPPTPGTIAYAKWSLHCKAIQP